MSDTVCPDCNRIMYTEPCLFCKGKCGAETHSGKGCRWTQEDCPVASHSVYRTYTLHELLEWEPKRTRLPDQEPPKKRRGTRGIGRAVKSHPDAPAFNYRKGAYSG